MSPEAAHFLAKARALLAQGETMIEASLPDAAGRNAYLAAFHVAQALIFEWSGRIAKTHRGVQSEFQRLTRHDTRVDPALRAFLSSAYDLKAIADYETGPDAGIPLPRARAALEMAGAFPVHFGDLAASPPG